MSETIHEELEAEQMAKEMNLVELGGFITFNAGGEELDTKVYEFTKETHAYLLENFETSLTFDNVSNLEEYLEMCEKIYYPKGSATKAYVLSWVTTSSWDANEGNILIFAHRGDYVIYERLEPVEGIEDTMKQFWLQRGTVQGYRGDVLPIKMIQMLVAMHDAWYSDCSCAELEELREEKPQPSAPPVQDRVILPDLMFDADVEEREGRL